MIERNAHKLHMALQKAHGLGRRERRLCRRILSLYSLDGKGGPSTSPAIIFFRPSFWEIFKRDADGPDGFACESVQGSSDRDLVAGVQLRNHEVAICIASDAQVDGHGHRYGRDDSASSRSSEG